MNINQHNKGQAISWVYLPDTNTLFQYLEREDLIELSKSCKRHRNQLERRVLESLSLDNWCKNNRDIYYELNNSRNYKKILKYMKTDLGSKIKFTRKFTLSNEINYPFAKKFVKLFPNIKSLILIENEDLYDDDDQELMDEDCHFSERSLITILKGMRYLEHVELEEFRSNINSQSKTPIFPKSLKSIRIYCKWGIDENSARLMIYDTIDSEYKNLYFISIASNRMLQNLPSGMPNLQVVEIKAEGLDKSEIVKFLKSNPQLKNINICSCYNEEIINIILSFKYLECLRICNEDWREIGIEINTLPSNYSIKSLIIARFTPDHLALKLADSCKNLKVLDLKNYRYINDLDWTKLEKRCNIIILSDFSLSYEVIKELDVSRLFDQIRFKLSSHNLSFIEDYNIDKLESYKFTHSISSTLNLKLIN